MNEQFNKKQLIPMIVGVLTMVLLVFGATYAYFSVSAGNNSGTTTITGDIGGDTLGSITLTGGNTELYLGVSAYDMSETNKGKVYYSSTTEGSRETNVNSAGKTTYTATLSGDETDSVMYACDYEFTVTSSGTAIGQESINDIELVFNGDINKTLNLTGSDKVSGTWYGFKKSNAEREFNAYLQLTNTEVEQNDLAGKNLSVEIENTKWKCYLSELDELVGEAYAILTDSGIKLEDIWDGKMETAYDLTMVRSETPLKVGDIYNGKVIDYVYSGIEIENYSSKNKPQWFDKMIASVSFDGKIRPISTAYWFCIPSYYDLGDVEIDVSMIDTALTTNMSHMFVNTYIESQVYVTGIENWNVSNVTNMSHLFADIALESIDLRSWDVSNVIDMSYMFDASWTDLSRGVTLNVSGWDVSNVTNMESMFASGGQQFEVIGLESWNVSSVTNMSRMFYEVQFNEGFDLSGWDVSNVTDMYGMFERSQINTNLDLSRWNVSNVTNHDYFADDISGTGTLTLPSAWQ